MFIIELENEEALMAHSKYFVIEKHLEDIFIKYNNNWGYVLQPIREKNQENKENVSILNKIS